MKVFNAYYSRTGNTGGIAKEIEKRLGENSFQVDTWKIKPNIRSGFLEMLLNSIRNKGVAVEYIDLKPAFYDYFIFGTPVWAANPASPAIEFLNRLPDLTGKKVAIYVTCNGMGGKRALQTMERNTEHANGELIAKHLFLAQRPPEELREEVQKMLEVFTPQNY